MFFSGVYFMASLLFEILLFVFSRARAGCEGSTSLCASRRSFESSRKRNGRKRSKPRENFLWSRWVEYFCCAHSASSLLPHACMGGRAQVFDMHQCSRSGRMTGPAGYYCHVPRAESVVQSGSQFVVVVSNRLPGSLYESASFAREYHHRRL